MHIIRLRIRHFRNIESIDWSPDPGLNLIWGDNGQGKTNLLEAVHMALTGRSFRARRDEQCLPWERNEDPADPTLTQADLEGATGQRRLRVLMGRNWKRAFADERWMARLADLWSQVAAVTFTPEEAGLFKGPPAGRRRFLDMVLCHLSRTYLDDLQRYGQALRQLNILLKRRTAARQVHESARAYYPILAQSGAAILIERARRLAAAAQSSALRFNAMGGEGKLDLSYDPNLALLATDGDEADRAEIAKAYRERLEAGFEESLRQGLCPIGVQRDDFAVRLDGKDLARYGSQGQHRLISLTLKLESARWIEEATGETPILLLDDFGSELDPMRRETVLRSLRGSMQVIVTATDPANLGPLDLFDRVCRIQGGAMCEFST